MKAGQDLMAGRGIDRTIRIMVFLSVGLAASFGPALLCDAEAFIDGIYGSRFSLRAKADHISTADGDSVYIFGYTDSGSPSSRAQYPGPTMIVPQGATVTVSLINDLPVPVSIVFPGQEDVSATGGSAGPLANEAPPDGTTVVTYSFIASEPGTYLYHSGTSPELQVEMGLVGALIVLPYGYNSSAPAAYGTQNSRYDHEYLFLLTEMDPRIHDVVEFQGVAALEGTDYLRDYFPSLWFINGRTAPDTMAMAHSPMFPTQPYNCVPLMQPGDRVLMRMVGAGRDMHPFQHEGNDATLLARDGRLLAGTQAPDADLGQGEFTTQTVPGGTADAIFEWPGKDTESISALPLQEEGNPTGVFAYMWHSGKEKEMANYDIFPGGMMTMLIIEPQGITMPQRTAYTVEATGGSTQPGSNVATVNITAGDDENTPPMAQDDYVSTAKNTSLFIKVLDNDLDPDGTLDGGSIVVVGSPSRGGSATAFERGVLFNPGKDFSGKDEFTYTVTDGMGAESNAATVRIDVFR